MAIRLGHNEKIRLLLIYSKENVHNLRLFYCVREVVTQPAMSSSIVIYITIIFDLITYFVNNHLY